MLAIGALLGQEITLLFLQQSISTASVNSGFFDIDHLWKSMPDLSHNEHPALKPLLSETMWECWRWPALTFSFLPFPLSLYRIYLTQIKRVSLSHVVQTLLAVLFSFAPQTAINSLSGRWVELCSQGPFAALTLAVASLGLGSCWDPSLQWWLRCWSFAAGSFSSSTQKLWMGPWADSRELSERGTKLRDNYKAGLPGQMG